MALTKVGNFVEGPSKVYTQGLFDVSATQKHYLGTQRTLSDGRVFVYAQAGGVNLVAGKLCQSPAPVAAHKDQLVKAAAAVGDKEVVVAIGATALGANDYKEGWLHINNAAGAGYAYKVRGHAAYAASATNVRILLYDEVRSALTADTSKYTLTKNKYAGVIVAPTTPTSGVVGVPPVAVPAGYYFWLQTKGECVCLADGTLVVGNPAVASNVVAGAVKNFVPGTSPSIIVGRVLQVNADTQYALIDLDL
jgi:hypothetical protein